jgi:hypothetical protein
LLHTGSKSFRAVNVLCAHIAGSPRGWARPHFVVISKNCLTILKIALSKLFGAQSASRLFLSRHVAKQFRNH